MKTLAWVVALALVGSLSFAVAASPGARPLSFAERLEAQEQIERLYFGHRVDSRRTFEDAVPYEAIAHRVRDSLRRSVALETVWGTPVSGEALDRELERIARNTLYPERLAELFAALNHDPDLIREALARPALVTRLTQAFYSRDERFHADSRERAERLRRQLVEGEIANLPDWATRQQLDLADGAAVASGDELSDLRASSRGVESVSESRDAFVIRRLAETNQGASRLEIYTVPKRAWHDWWAQVGPTMDISSLRVPEGLPKELPESTGASSAQCVNDVWDNGSLDTGALIGRDLHVTVWTGNLMLVFGGSRVWNTGSRYDPLLDEWTPMRRPEFLGSVERAAAVWTGSEMIVWGGETTDGEKSNAGGRYDPVTDSWTPTSLIGAPAARDGHTAVWTGSEMIVWGGEVTGAVSGDGGRYDPATDSWAPIDVDATISPRRFHTAVWTGTEMIVWGGSGDSGVEQGTGGRYAPGVDAWTPLSTAMAPASRTLHTAVWTGTEMLVWGGTPFGPGGRYDPQLDLWQSVATHTAPSSDRFEHTAVWTGDRMVVWGGWTGSISSYRDDGGLYDPQLDSWTGTSQVNAPSARRRPVAVWTGDRMVVFGGVECHSGSFCGEGKNTGARYDPVGDQWTPTSPGPSGQPSRVDHRAVWTGNQMFVWGGSSSQGARNDGALYDPLLDLWTPVSGAPGVDARGTAVWTGEEVIVWGGSGNVDTGGRYDPLLDSWTPTSTIDAPQARGGHSAIWTGERMVVWGGGQACGWPPYTPPVTGGLYDPETNTWTATATSGAPFGRFGQTAVWTGTEMLVWGGHGYYVDTFGDCFSSSATPSGGRFNPATNSWSSMAAADVARTQHTAVWTGTEMLVWGGGPTEDAAPSQEFDTGSRYAADSDDWVPSAIDGASGPAQAQHTAVWTGKEMLISGRNPGGRYDPATGTWIAMSLTDAPVPRRGHSAIWTGDTMIVWGGGSLTAPAPDTGGRYRAAEPPAEVETLTLQRLDGGLASLSWPDTFGANTYAITRGAISTLAVGDYGPCLVSGITSTHYDDSDIPAAGQTFTYLVQAENPSCGMGELGQDSSQQQRINQDPQACLP